MRARDLACALAILAAACSGGTNNADMATADDLSAGPDLAPAPDLAMRTLSVRAKKGLEISPVKIDTTNLTLDQQEVIGTGSYLVATVNCGSCHNHAAGANTDFLAGGNAFGGATPSCARNLTPDAATGMKLSEAQFIEVMRTGKDFVDMGQLRIMPFVVYRWMTTYDLKAIYAYLKVIPAVSNAVMPDMKPAVGTPTPAPTMYTDGDVTRALPGEDVADP